ncbi:response regulator [Henriciella barbarensis]|uniref:response regulator n=1 Tax=Henriciella barbarensis TaxID=86342 RepID=UPI001F2ECEB8|nr:response regulator transcription factor [Henriciella barbarensis]
MKDQIRLLIVDDHELAREGLKSAFIRGGMDVVAAAKNGAEALKLIAEHEPDLVVLDIRLGDGMDGLGVAKEVSKLLKAPKIMMLTLHDDPDYVRAALDAGATGYVLKDASLNELCEAARQVMAGGTAIPAALLSSLLARPDRQHDDELALSRLTPRERAVLDHVAEGMTNKAIARELSISPATVKAHVERLIAKLGVADRTQAAVLATRWRERQG